MEFSLPWKWNGEGIKLQALRQLLEVRKFDLATGNILIEIGDKGEWNFSNPPKASCPKCGTKHWSFQKCPKKLKAEHNTETQYVPINETIAMEVGVEKPKKEIPLCKKCGTEHWPMHKCPTEKEE